MGLEVLIICAVLYFRGQKQLTRTGGLIFMTNACTHPIVVFVIMKSGVYLSSIFIAESFAWLFEAYIYRGKIVATWRQAIILSLVANLASWQLGPWITQWVLSISDF